MNFNKPWCDWNSRKFHVIFMWKLLRKLSLAEATHKNTKKINNRSEQLSSFWPARCILWQRRNIIPVLLLLSLLMYCHVNWVEWCRYGNDSKQKNPGLFELSRINRKWCVLSFVQSLSHFMIVGKMATFR